MTPLLRAEGLVKRFGGRRVVDAVSFSVAPRQIVGLLGPNGAGKTTTFHLLTGLIKPQGGEIYFEGRRITAATVVHRARMGLYYLPQEPSVFRKLSARDNLHLVLEARRLSRPARERRAEALLRKFQLAHLAERRADTLSSGERRRLELARALACRPKILLLDEPFSGIDPLSVESLQELILALVREEGLGVVITDHNVRETLKITDHAYLINEGRVLLAGPPAQIVADPLARKFYLGRRFRLE